MMCLPELHKFSPSIIFYVSRLYYRLFIYALASTLLFITSFLLIQSEVFRNFTAKNLIPYNNYNTSLHDAFCTNNCYFGYITNKATLCKSIFHKQLAARVAFLLKRIIYICKNFLLLYKIIQYRYTQTLYKNQKITLLSVILFPHNSGFVASMSSTYHFVLK